jgi:hypothetical protein
VIAVSLNICVSSHVGRITDAEVFPDDPVPDRARLNPQW